MATLLKEMGLKVEHENYREDGTVSYRHLEQHKRFSPILHQVRHPLKVFRSADVLKESTQYRRCKELTMRDPKLTIKLEQIMWSWVNWCTAADAISEYRYKIEDFDEIYPEVFKKLGIAPPNPLPDIPKDTNSWVDNGNHIEEVTWDMLYDLNPILAAQVNNLAEEYNYE